MSLTDLSTVVKWARETCHALYGSDEGERVFRALPVSTVMQAWRSIPRGLFFA